MQEYVTQAVVLGKEPVREKDVRYSFFTKRFGKVVGKATSARKITSKLAGHLEPGTLATVRLVEKGGTQIVDALKSRTVKANLPDLRFLNTMTTEGERDDALWVELTAEDFSWKRVLALMGWDSEGAACENCKRALAYFYLPRQEFFCAPCASNFRADGLLLVSNNGKV
jgi:recombinational DNA repair protein (RecF pathway)